MVNPQTVNVGLIVPLTGADVDLWGEDDVNPNMVATDGLFAGVQTISATNVPITLTSPAGFVPTPGGGPTQSQNRVLRFTGVLTGNVVVTLPIPGSYIVENLTTGNFVLSFRGVTATEVIGTPQGERVEIYNDGANVRFVNLARMGALEMWVGLTAMPAWVNACTIRPYLLNDGTVWTIADFPALGNRLLSQFGGNGTTTFAVPDSRGRVPLSYDGTGTRITTAGCGINGQVLGAAGGSESSQLSTVNLPPYTPTGTQKLPQVPVAVNATAPTTQSVWSNSYQDFAISLNPQGGTSVPFPNVPPAQVTGIWVTKT